MDIDQELSLASQYQQIGKNYEARTILRNILAVDRRNEQAWLLFSEVAEKPAHEIQCLQTVLKINPANAYAAQKLQQLRTPSDGFTAGRAGSPDARSGWARKNLLWIVLACTSFCGLCVIAVLLIVKGISS